MKRAGYVFLSAILSFSCLSSSALVSAQQPNENVPVTLYSMIKHRGEQRKSCLDFQKGPGRIAHADCDLKYGLLYAGDELDWFQSPSSQGDRSVIKDLGEHDWSTRFEVPGVEPLPKLKPGEQRQVTVDTSGADGAPGKPGANGADANSAGADFRGEKSPGDMPGPPNAIPEASTPAARPRKPKVDPMFVKAIAGHMYVIHIVDDSRDFYGLFRVEALERGDNCTVSWKIIPTPATPSQ